MAIVQSTYDNLISDEVKEIVSHRPHWIIRKGNTILFIIVFLLFAMTWFISYPDIIKGSSRFVSLNSPKMMVAKTEGKLDNLLVFNEQEVKANQHLAYLQ